MKTSAKIAFLFISLLALQGCMTRLEATKTPGADIKDFGGIYVQHFDPDKRNFHYVIADKLTLLGYPAKPLRTDDIPEDADLLITYIDNWRWDITNYMLKIKIDVRDADSLELLISGESFRTSLARRAPETMIQEALEEILTEAGLSYKKVQK